MRASRLRALRDAEFGLLATPPAPFDGRVWGCARWFKGCDSRIVETPPYSDPPATLCGTHSLPMDTRIVERRSVDGSAGLAAHPAGAAPDPCTVLKDLRWAPYREFGIPDPAGETFEAPAGPVLIGSVGYRDGDVIVYWSPVSCRAPDAAGLEARAREERYARDPRPPG